jgi:hypothetical protein
MSSSLQKPLLDASYDGTQSFIQNEMLFFGLMGEKRPGRALARDTSDIKLEFVALLTEPTTSAAVPTIKWLRATPPSPKVTPHPRK